MVSAVLPRLAPAFLLAAATLNAGGLLAGLPRARAEPAWHPATPRYLVLAGLPHYAAQPTQADLAAGLARELPCAAVTAQTDGSHLRLSGLALRDDAWNRFQAAAKAIQGVTALTVDVDPVGAYACPAIAVVARFMESEQQGAGHLEIRSEARQLPVGARLNVVVPAARDVDVRLDMFHPDGSVTHLVTARQGGEVRASESAAGPIGSRLLVGLATPVPLGLAPRPAKEPAGPYLKELRDALSHAQELSTAPILAGLTTIEVRSSPSAASGAPRPPQTSSGRCAAILERLQLGEVLSNADRTILQTDCRS
jgi:hypothetical protein